MFELTEKLFIVLSLVVFGNTEVAFENGGYSVLVSFSQNIQSKDGKELLDNMKASLQDASEILHNAIGLPFSKVTFELPTSWDISELDITLQDSLDLGSSKTDFLIDGANDVVFGKSAFAQQYGSCGVPGKKIVIPTAFFHKDNTFPKGTTLAREWLKYLYGVFDENGYLEDPMYPQYYTTPGRDPNDVKITDCTNEEVTYNFLDQDGNNCSANEGTLFERLDSGECKAIPDEENATSSIMYFQKDISTMQHICGKEPEYVHNSRSPNKQNTLCSGQSIWDVVKKSVDFPQEITSGEYKDIEYVYVQDAKPKIIVAWENIQYKLTNEENKNKENKGPFILNAVKKFMIDLPNGSKFNGFPFKASLQTPDKRDYSLHNLNGPDEKRRIIEDISSDFVTTEPGDINLAISKALEIFQSAAPEDSELKGTIVVITKSIGSIDETVIEKLNNKKVCLKLMFFSDNGTIPEEMESYASALPCATLEAFSMSDEGKDIYGKLFKSMDILLPSTVDDKVTETVATEILSEESSISFKVDDTVEVVTFWVFSKKESESFILKINYGREEKVVEAGNFGNILALTYSPTTAERIEFSYPHDDPIGKILTDVRVTYKGGKYINGEVFIHDTSEKDSSVQMPVIIYAFIRFGAYPVQYATVTAEIKGPDGNIINRGLSDEGKGDPDITKNDGIYSRYFTKFSGEGEYTVTVTVRSNDFTTYGADENADYETCCGSSVKNGSTKLTKIEKVFGTTFHAKSGRPDDGYKPSRILDLRVAEVADDKIILKWTAPGGEADTEIVQSYEIKRFTSQDEAVNNFDNGEGIFDFTNSPKDRGSTERFEINFGDFEEDGLSYITIKSKNSNNKTSDLSNIVEIFVPDRKTTTEPPEGDKDKQTKQSSVNTKIVGIIIGVIVGLIILVILAYMAVYYLVVKPKREKEEKPNQISRDPLPPSENINPINFVSATTLIEHHKEKEKAKIENKEPPIFKEEDFEKKNTLPADESGQGSTNNDQELENKDKVLENGQHIPPKSPKRTTYV